MQRRNVLLPDPEGPIRHRTSPRPHRQVDALQHLEPPEGLVDGPRLDHGHGVATGAGAGSGGRQSWGATQGTSASAATGRTRRWSQGRPEPLERRGRQGPGRAPGVVALDVVLPDGHHRGEEQVPEAGHERGGARPGSWCWRCSGWPGTGRPPAITDTSDVVLSIEMVSLPVGGMMTRMAWGRTIRRRVRPLDIPSDGRRLGLALVHRDDAGPDDLGHVGALVEAEAEGAGHEGGDQGVRVERDQRRCRRATPEASRCW